MRRMLAAVLSSAAIIALVPTTPAFAASYTVTVSGRVICDSSKMPVTGWETTSRLVDVAENYVAMSS